LAEVARGFDSKQAFALFRDVVGGSSWPAFGHLAAEARAPFRPVTLPDR
jgi:hypothetical protein